MLQKSIVFIFQILTRTTMSVLDLTLRPFLAQSPHLQGDRGCQMGFGMTRGHPKIGSVKRDCDQFSCMTRDRKS